MYLVHQIVPRVHNAAALTDTGSTGGQPPEGTMNVNEPNRSSVGSSAASARARQTVPTPPAHSSEEQSPAAPASAEDIHLAELLRTLRSLAADSPERQAKIEGLVRAYASGDLQVDADATASAIIDEAVIARSTFR
jgi:anti-sigma28 factor (negative regulator of flagellin synthesis)